jgi:hypothetical protein
MLPIVDEGRVVGVVTRRAMLAAALRQLVGAHATG